MFGFIPLKLKELEGSLISIKNVDGQDVIVEHIQGTRTLVGSRIQPYDIPDSWKKRFGMYELEMVMENLIYIKSITIRKESNFLFADFITEIPPHDTEIRGSSVLIPVSDTQAIIAGIGRGKGNAMIFEDDGGEERLRFLGLGYKRRND